MRTNYLHSYCQNFEFRTEYYNSNLQKEKQTKKTANHEIKQNESK